MDAWGIGIFAVGLILYYATQRKYGIFLFTSGIGAGIFIGALWAMQIINNILR